MGEHLHLYHTIKLVNRSLSTFPEIEQIKHDFRKGVLSCARVIVWLMCVTSTTGQFPK